MKYCQIFNNNIYMTKAEVNESTLIILSMKSQVKPASVQERILRRIIEKRHAQTNHRMSKVIVPGDLEPIN